MKSNLNRFIKPISLVLFVVSFILTTCLAEYDDQKGMYAKVKTSLGSFVIELDFAKAPLSSANFIRYAKEGFYDGTVFHSVIPSVMIQGGGFLPDLNKKNNGLHKPIQNEWQNGLKNLRGSVSMVHVPSDNMSRAQFFVNVNNNTSLDQARRGVAYAVFGKVVEGMETVDRINAVELVSHPKYPGGKVVPKAAVLIQSVEITGKYNTEKLMEVTEELDKVPEQETLALKKIEDLEKQFNTKAEKRESGLYYIPVQEGKGNKPKGPGAKVKAHYEGTLLNGTVFDSSYKRGTPIDFGLSAVIKGWTEGLQLMRTGGIAYLVIPPDLGYGSGGGGPIPPNSWLIFKVELISTF